MNTLKKFDRKLFVLSMAGYILALMLYGAWDYMNNRSEILKNIDSKLYNNAVSVKFILPEDIHDRATAPDSISVREDKEIANKMTDWVNETGIKYAYTVIKKNQTLFFIASDLVEYPETERGTFYYYAYENPDQSFINAFEKETPTYRTVTDQWGTVRTVMIPERSPGGIVYLACADYDISHVKALLQKSLIKSIAIVIFFVLLAVPIVNLYMRSYKIFLNEIKESEKKYRDLFETSIDAILLLDAELNYLDCNPAAIRLFDVPSKEQFLALNPVDLSPEQQPDGVSSFEKARVMMDQTAKSGLGLFEWRHKKLTGQEFDASVLLSRVKIDGQTVIQGTVRDISDQKRTQAMLIQSEKMMSVGGLATGMAHEINNPLAGMIQNATVLSNRLTNIALPANKKAADAANLTMESIFHYMELRDIPSIIKAITESGARIVSIIDNMLSFARKSDSTFSDHNPVELLDRALELAAIDFDLNRHYDFKSIIITKIYEDHLPQISCEGSQIQQVFMNIFKNGAHAMFENPDQLNPEFTVRIQHEKSSGMLKIEIEDNGPGMDTPTCKRIFEPFFTTKPVGVGTGLGLSVSYFIITENHGGTLTVRSDPGNGTTFIICLPIAGKNTGPH